MYSFDDDLIRRRGVNKRKNLKDQDSKLIFLNN